MGNSNSAEEELKKREQELKKREEECKKREEERIRKEILENEIREKVLREFELKNHQQEIQKRKEELRRLVVQQDELRRIKAQQEAHRKAEQEERKRKEELRRIELQQEELRRVKAQQEAQKKSQQLDDKIQIYTMVKEKVRTELEREKVKLQEEFKRQLEEQKRKETLEKQKIFIDSLIQYKITKNLPLINDLRRSFGIYVLKDYPESPYTEKLLFGTSRKYRTVQNMFRKRNMPYFYVTKILEIDNPFLVLHYNLTKEKLTKNIDEDIDESVLFHGTKCEYLKGICSFNFDRSKVKTHSLGWGISFSTRSFCATYHHKDNTRKKEKVMVLAKVLVDEVELGDRNTVIPEEPCYTTTSKDESVIVKFDDASFYPVYIVHYEGIHHFLNKQTGSLKSLTGDKRSEKNLDS